MIRLVLAALAFVSVAMPAEARQHRHHHHHSRHHLIHIAAQATCADLFCWIGGQQTSPAVTNPRPRLARETASYGRGEVVSHPSSCPHVAFCGCGAAVRVFGHSVRELWLAANWFRFPRAAPAPGMAAVRAHHVFVLEADLGGGVWQVFDANSGGHQTRVHPRSIAGYTIVDPHGGVS
jgi:hypothetical protein